MTHERDISHDRDGPHDRDISRREAVRRLTVLAGGALSSSTVAALLGGCDTTATVADEWTPTILDTSQLEKVTVVVDAILPRTDTPGASDVGVPAFIDRVLADHAEPEERIRVLDGLDGLDDASREAVGVAFLEADTDGQVQLLTTLDTEAVRAREDRDDPLPFFATIKEWTLLGYYTSEAGATRELQWLAMPGRWDADVPLTEVGRTWA